MAGVKGMKRAKTVRAKGWTPESFVEALQLQEGRCWICRVPFVGAGSLTNACADHDHVTGKRRGLLCSRCNLMEGHIKALRTIGLSAGDWADRLNLFYLDTFISPGV